MAHFTGKANGNFGAGGQTTWNEVGVPGSGDTCDPNGKTVTVNDARNITGFTLTGTGSYNGELNVVSGGSLVTSGDGVVSDWGHLNITGTGAVDIGGDLKGRPYPAGVVDRQKITVAGTDINNRASLTVAGTLDFSQFMITDSGSKLIFSGSFANIQVGGINLTYARSIVLNNYTKVHGYGASTAVLGALGDADLRIIGGARLLGTGQHLCGQNAVSTGLREIGPAVIGGTFIATSDGWTTTGPVVWLNALNDSASAGWNVFEGFQFVQCTNPDGSPWAMPAPATGEVADVTVFHNNPSNNNCSWFDPSNYGWGGGSTLTMRRILMLADIAGNQGDMLHGPALGSGRKVLYRNCGSYPNLDGEQPGCFGQFSQLDVNMIDIQFCTMHTTYGALVANETTVTPAGAISHAKNCLAWRKTNGAGAIYVRMVNATDYDQDIIDPAECGHNGMVNITATPSPAGPDELTYALAYVGFGVATSVIFATAPEGIANGSDVYKSSINPFVDWDRHVTKYAVDRGLASGGDSDATKKAAFLAAMTAQFDPSDPDYNSAVFNQDFQEYLMGGLVLTDPDFKAAEGGEWMGAFGGIEGGGGGSLIPQLLQAHIRRFS